MVDHFFLSSTATKKKTIRSLSCPCGLEKTCSSPYMLIGGYGRKEILVIGEAPNKIEDEMFAEKKTVEQQLKGEAGKRLEKELDAIDVDLHKDCFKINAVNCRPPKNRAPTGLEISACRSRVMKAIQETNPKVILALGSSALESLYGHRWYGQDEGLGNIARWRGLAIPDQDLKTWVYPVYHPSYVLRSEHVGKTPQIELYFSLDIQKFAEVIEQADSPFPEYTPNFKILSENETIKILKKYAQSQVPIVFDYETTGIKPHARGHEVVYASVCRIDRDIAYAFEMTDSVVSTWKEFLQSDCPKIAQNIKFEEKWSRAIFGVEVNNWVWDTMLASHFLDNRGGNTSLKFQTLINFGTVDYSYAITHFLKSKESLALNNIHQASKKEVLEYCAKDSWFTKELYKLQKEKVNDAGLELLIEGAQALMDDEENGVVLDKKYVERQKAHLLKRIEAIRKRIENSEDGTLWKKHYTIPNYGSNQQLAHMLFKVMGLQSKKLTQKGNASVDVEALESLKEDVSLVADILEMRKLDKIQGTYLAGWERETGEDNIMRAFYHIHTVKTFRSSSSNPNYQNVPIRDPAAGRILRRAIRPRAGHVLLEVDFSGIEVRVGACYHKDPQMIKYITDPTTDMHRDMAMECYRLELEEVSKSARQGAKNQFVFPEFYGSYWGNTGPGLWKWAETSTTAQGVSLIKHLKKKGLKSEEQFVQHIKKVERKFWGDRFRIYADWKEKWWKKYLKKGYFDTLTGFRCQGPMSHNEAVNYPIQGSAFHCLLKSKSMTKEYIQETWPMEILPCGQIHDSGLFSCAPETLPYFTRQLHYLWCEKLRELWDWIIVPLEIEIEVTPVNGSWYEKKKYEEKEDLV